MKNKTILSALGAIMIVGISLGLVPAALAATPVLTAINLTPAVVAVGATHQFTASPLDQFGNPIAATLTWSSSNTSVGTVNGSGLFSALAVGSATVTATSGSVSGSTTATVVAATPVLTTITVNPSSASVMVGNTRQFTATTRDQFGNPIAATLTWTSSNTAVGTVNGSGLFSALAVGSATVTATSGAVSGSATATVTVSAPTVVNSITVSPLIGVVRAGNTEQFTATLHDQNGNAVSGSVTWSLSDTSVGMIDSNGLFAAAANGSSLVMAKSGDVTGFGAVLVTNARFDNNNENEDEDEEEDEEDENENHGNENNTHSQGDDHENIHGLLNSDLRFLTKEMKDERDEGDE